MSDPESKREDRFESTVRKLLRKADENRNYVVGGVVALLLIAGAIYFKVVSAKRREDDAWVRMHKAETTGILREQWKKYRGTSAGIFLAEELATRLFDEQEKKIDKTEEGVIEERLALLDESISVLGEAIEEHSSHPFAPHLKTMLENFRSERDWISKHGPEILATREPIPKKIDPKQEKMNLAEHLDDRPGQRPLITLVTDRGEIVVELYEDDAPNHVANLISLVLEGFYDDLIFHRVEDWVVRTGSPEGTGGGGPGYRIKAEITKHGHDRGAFGMARSEDMDSAGSQFYIVKKEKHDIDGRYTIFGRVLTGMDIVDRLQRGDNLNEIRVDRMRTKQYQPLVIYAEKKPTENK